MLVQGRLRELLATRRIELNNRDIWHDQVWQRLKKLLDVHSKRTCAPRGLDKIYRHGHLSHFLEPRWMKSCCFYALQYGVNERI